MFKIQQRFDLTATLSRLRWNKEKDAPRGKGKNFLRKRVTEISYYF